ncbi:MAG: hypothetical protein H6719_32930 [Sandaracinaceae bacterium]|nr:hypothetical protein [Sandaracinaceae bacterium]
MSAHPLANPLTLALVTIALVLGAALAASPAAAQRAPVSIVSQSDPMTLTLTGPDGVGVPCSTPCNVELEPGDYQLEARARGLRTTAATLHAGEQAAIWSVRSGGSAAFVWGVILTSFGAAAVGLTVGFVGMALTSAPGDSYNEMMAVILGTMGGLVGGASLIGGVALIASNLNGVEVGLTPTPGGAAARLRAPF